MDDIHGLHTVHAPDQLPEEPECLEFGEPTMALDVVSQIATLAVLQEDIEIGAWFLNVDEIDDVLVFAFAK